MHTLNNYFGNCTTQMLNTELLVNLKPSWHRYYFKLLSEYEYGGHVGGIIALLTRQLSLIIIHFLSFYIIQSLAM